MKEKMIGKTKKGRKQTALLQKLHHIEHTP
jgi:hypothetical protein